MAESSDPNLSITGTLLFYTQPELLSSDAHAKLGVNPAPTRYGFAAKTHLSPLSVPEFGPASLTYPIIFVGDQRVPVAVLGLTEGQNLFTDATGGMEDDVYVPCYIRRYPFVLAGGQNGEDRMMVCIDRAYEYITENAQYPFFENGKPTTYTQNCIQFCNDFEQQNRTTQSFIALLNELDLFDSREATYQPVNPDGTKNGDLIQLAQYVGISDEKLKALPADKIQEMNNSGALQQIYNHLNSMFNWERLLMRANRANAQPVAANA